MTERGRFITLEGIEGVGKSTQAALLADWLEGEGIDVVRSREPGGTAAAEAIRELLKHSPVDSISAETELLLIFAARSSHAEAVLRPQLAAGRWVLCDRYLDASYAYQGAGRGLGDARVAALADWLVPDLTPDLTLLFDLPVDDALARLPGRGAHDRFEHEDGDFFRRVREGYLARAASEPKRVKRVDANGTAEEVQARCRALVAPFLNHSKKACE
ncbi:MAG: dTMP kinase [Gammaproteobacteria bacterium]